TASRPGPTLESARTRTPTRSQSVDLLQRANELRAQRNWRKAEHAYVLVVTEHPSSTESYAALVAAAALRLEHLHDAGGALLFYRAALRRRPTGALAEEASYGIAECQRALGNPKAETEALRHFLKAYPNSLLRSKAQSRAHALEEVEHLD